MPLHAAPRGRWTAIRVVVFILAVVFAVAFWSFVVWELAKVL